MRIRYLKRMNEIKFNNNKKEYKTKTTQAIIFRNF